MLISRADSHKGRRPKHQTGEPGGSAHLSACRTPDHEPINEPLLFGLLRGRVRLSEMPRIHFRRIHHRSRRIRVLFITMRSKLQQDWTQKDHRREAESLREAESVRSHDYMGGGVWNQGYMRGGVKKKSRLHEGRSLKSRLQGRRSLKKKIKVTGGGVLNQDYRRGGVWNQGYRRET